MKRILIAIVCVFVLFSGCAGNNTKQDILKIGDSFSVTGIVEYSDEPSDIGQEYCFITGNKKIEYYYTDIYGEQSQFASNVFYTKGNDTALLKEYIGREVTLSGLFDAESHGIPYITNITVK